MKRIFILLLTVILLFSSFIMSVNAVDFKCSVCDETYEHTHCKFCGTIEDDNHSMAAVKEKHGSMADFALEMKEALYCNVFESLDGFLGFRGMTISNLLTLNSEDGVMKEIFDKANALYSAISIIGFILVFLYFLIEIVEEYLQKDGFTYETFTRFCLKTIFAFLLIRNGMEIFTFVIDLGSSIFSSISNTTSFGEFGNSLSGMYAFTKSNCPITEYLDIGNAFFAALGDILYNIIPYAVVSVVKVLLVFTLYARLLEIVVRVAFAPIGMSDIFTNGRNSAGWVYLKKFIAAVLQGACVAGIFMSYGWIVAFIRGTVNGYIGTIVITLVLFLVANKAQQLARDIVGV